ncbi:MAG: hypothetical protein Q9209_004667 [Squamulea sp. 1 TL-2023]
MESLHFDVAVVGAGICGIAAAKFYLDIHPNCKLIILEKDASVGGVWNQSRVFDTFYTQSPFGTWEYSDMPMPQPPGEDMYNGVFKAKYTSQYLEDYIDLHKYMGKTIRQRINFNFEVQRITKCNGQWIVSGRDSSGQFALQSSKLIIASGLTSVPNMPDLPGYERFQNPILHQKDFGQSAILSTSDTESITVLGGAKSAADLVYDCVQAGKRVTWIVRKTGTGPGFFVSAESSVSPRTIYALSTARIIATLSPSLFNADSWWNRFLQRTRMGRKQLTKFWNATDKAVAEAPNFNDRGPEARKNGFQNLKPHTPVMWQNQGAGLINRPNFWDTIAQHVRIYHEDIQELHKGAIRLKNGEDIHCDAILCGTGWIPSLGFFDQGLLAELGIPQPIENYPLDQAEIWEALEKDADQEVLDRFPILANPPEHYHTPVTETPYRLYKGIAPLRDDSIAFVGHVLVANYFRIAECQAIWATAYLDGKIKLPPLEQRRKDVALFVAWCRRRYLSNGDRGHWMSAEQTGYTDTLFHELGLSSHRRVWLWDAFVLSSKKDLHRVRTEYFDRFGREIDLRSSAEGHGAAGGHHQIRKSSRELLETGPLSKHHQAASFVRSIHTTSSRSGQTMLSTARTRASPACSPKSAQPTPPAHTSNSQTLSSDTLPSNGLIYPASHARKLASSASLAPLPPNPNRQLHPSDPSTHIHHTTPIPLPQPQPRPQPTNTVYIIRALEGWREPPTNEPKIKVDILSVFLDVEHANEYTRRWLRMQYGWNGEGEVVNGDGDGGIQVDVLTGKVDGTALVDVERHFVC